jgi:AbrB family looped-hinge helix DNA binding protein
MKVLQPDHATFTTKGQIVVPARLRRQFDIKQGTRAAVIATPEGILLKPMTAAAIRHGRGILKRSKPARSFAQKWAEQKNEEKRLEDRYAKQGSR